MVKELYQDLLAIIIFVIFSETISDLKKLANKCKFFILFYYLLLFYLSLFYLLLFYLLFFYLFIILFITILFIIFLFIAILFIIFNFNTCYLFLLYF